MTIVITTTPSMANDYLLEVTIKAGSKNNKIDGWHNRRLKISLKAPATEGKANAALISFLAEILKIPKSHIDIIKGETSKFKTIQLPIETKSAFTTPDPQINHTHPHQQS